MLVGRIKGVERPPLAPLIPTLKGVSLLIDCGANVDARPSHLVQFARMGSIYMESVMGKKNPTVGIVNIGAEEEKGNALVKETFPLLKECSDINFIGSVEARDIPLAQPMPYPATRMAKLSMACPREKPYCAMTGFWNTPHAAGMPVSSCTAAPAARIFGVAVLFLGMVFFLLILPVPHSLIQLQYAPVFVDKKRWDRYDKEVYLLIFPRAAARADNREEQP